MLPASAAQSVSIMNSVFPADAEFASWKDEAAVRDMEVGSLVSLVLLVDGEHAPAHPFAHIHYSNME